MFRNPPSVVRSTNENLSSFGFTRPIPDRINTRSSLNIHPQQTKSITPCPPHHHVQELCFVCHQRAKRNIPVYIHEEKRNRENEETRLLEQYQHDKEVEEQRKRDVNKLNIVFQNLFLLFI